MGVLCVHSRPKGPEQTRGEVCVCVSGGCCGIIHTAWMLKGNLWTGSGSLTSKKRLHGEHTHTCTQIGSDKPGPRTVTPASAAVRTALWPRPPQVALRYERTGPDAVNTMEGRAARDSPGMGSLG